MLSDHHPRVNTSILHQINSIRYSIGLIPTHPDDPSIDDEHGAVKAGRKSDVKLSLISSYSMTSSES